MRMKRILLLSLSVVMFALITGCGIVRKYVPEKSCHIGSWLPNGISEDVFEEINASNTGNPGVYSEGLISFNAAKGYRLPASVFDISGSTSAYTHIAFEVKNENDYTLKRGSVTFLTNRANVSVTCYSDIKKGETGIVLFPVSNFGNIRINKLRRITILYSNHGEECVISLKDVYPVAVSVGLRKTVCEIRDPFILSENGIYYMYGTGWQYYKNTSGDINGEWTGPYSMVDWNRIKELLPDYEQQCWAPEVYKYGDAYYAITTYNSSERGGSVGTHKYDGRGTVILRAETPEGPFTKWSDGLITPDSWDCIDGTLYIDDNGQPWLFFVHEWTSTDGEGGKFACAKLSSDLKTLISEPKDVFSTGGVTDGCFIYTAANGDLLSLWSTYDDDYGYCVNVIRSKNGIDGDWQFDDLLYSSYYGNESGGHGMLFTDTDGLMKMSFHIDSDNNYAAFINVKEENNKLVLSDLTVSEIPDQPE